MAARRAGFSTPVARALAAALLAAGTIITTATGLLSQAQKPAPERRDQASIRLQRDIDALLSEPALQRTTWGIVITSLQRKDDLYTLNDHKLLLPASNMKIVTLAVAAERLGWSYSFPTSLIAMGPIEDGTLEGDLLVVGEGDPSIDNWDGAGAKLFARWAEGLKALGVAAIKGRIVGDDDAFEDEGFGAGWAWDDLDRSFATGVGALQFNQNSVQLVVTPGPVGQPATVALNPEYSGLNITNQITTVAVVTPSIVSRRGAGAGAIELRGTVRPGTQPMVRPVSVPNPTLYFVNALRAALIDEGIAVAGEAVDIDDLAERPARARGTVLVSHASPPLSTLATTMMKLSQNLYAETLFKAAGAAGAPGAIDRNSGIATAAAGREIVTKTLEQWGVPREEMVVTDGSGLSRYNLITPRALSTVLTHVDRTETLKVPFESALPLGGVDGTLAGRLRGTAAAKNVRAKTGAFSNARALSGYVKAANGEPLVFVLLANNFGVPAEAVEKAMDGIIVKLAQFRR